MTVKHQQSTPITNAQAVPVVPNYTGAGAGGKIVEVGSYVTVVAASAALVCQKTLFVITKLIALPAFMLVLPEPPPATPLKPWSRVCCRG